MSAPERITALASGRWFVPSSTSGPDGSYVRADLHQQVIAERDALKREVDEVNGAMFRDAEARRSDIEMLQRALAERDALRAALDHQRVQSHFAGVRADNAERREGALRAEVAELRERVRLADAMADATECCVDALSDIAGASHDVYIDDAHDATDAYRASAKPEKT